MPILNRGYPKLAMALTPSKGKESRRQGLQGKGPAEDTTVTVILVLTRGAVVSVESLPLETSKPRC